MLRSWLTKLAQWRLKREAVRTLHELDDRRLRDIGTFRDSIELFVEEQAEPTEESTA